MASHPNPICAKCPKAHNSLNGRYCRQLKRYVQYTDKPQCLITQKNNEQ